MKKLQISTKPCLIIERRAFYANKLVYVLCANKKHRYQWGRSKIVYIGTTEKGADRIGNSVVNKGRDILDHHGINQVKAFMVTCSGGRGMKDWPKKLESAFLYNFREYYGCIPLLNKQCGPKQKEDVSTNFSEAKIDRAIAYFSNLK